ncbi:pyruvate ferredoxin oxidoreductase subunit gamma [Candidatus Micrarchaeota archaeon]|nr:pyruvate ferredoxin oxidoreductase subunit gamma [Candidatus Micrarchaeota archaeon]MBD3418257.1 pyruvate ferredoxin oxidoreductase subunit gamma [Candidatus Micrarchaeota archaeon]
MLEIRLHGRGGQGAVTGGELLAKAAGLEGKWSQCFPKFGVERRGAPVQSYCRIADERIKIHQELYEPNAVIVLDASLMDSVDVTAGLKEGGTVLINTRLPPGDVCLLDGNCNVHTVDATTIAKEALGRPIVNTAMLGAFVKITGIVKLESLVEEVKKHFGERLGEKNADAVKACYEAVK